MARTCPKNSNWFEFEGLVAGTKVGPCVRLDFEEKVASSHDGTCPRDLLQGLVAGTSLIVCGDLEVIGYSCALLATYSFVDSSVRGFLTKCRGLPCVFEASVERI